MALMYFELLAPFTCLPPFLLSFSIFHYLHPEHRYIFFILSYFELCTLKFELEKLSSFCQTEHENLFCPGIELRNLDSCLSLVDDLAGNETTLQV
jgi:hypothetical protein